jgi:hypothetical protein
LDCDTGGTRGIFPARTSIHPRQERNNALEPTHHAGQGVMEALWSILGNLGARGCHDSGIPIFLCTIIYIYIYIYIYGVLNTRDNVSLRGMEM